MFAHRVKYWVLILLLTTLSASAQSLHHDLEVRLEPAEHRLEVRDVIRLPQDAPDHAVFQLHADLNPRVLGEGATLTRLQGIQTGASGISVETYRVTLDPGVHEFTLSYAGEIHHPVTDLGEEYARSFSVSPGLIEADGVFLGGSSHWLPHFSELPFLTFEMAVQLPEGWRAVSQGERTTRSEVGGNIVERWAEQNPQEEIYLIAARFNEYRRAGTTADALVFLREADEALAERYLELTGRYIEMYQRLIGPYPYGKFALVENFWETGYGMPSFTLLGPSVIRLPFIPYTSYPHEILHNWWGNGVYVDYASGNWSEGLTSYLADHLLKEQRGTGAEYRRGTLQKYADYVDANKDFPLVEFRGRHSAVTEAVGYGKTLMVFHMLRRRLGDDTFIAGLRRLYADNAFKVAGWPEVARAFNAVADAPLDVFFDQWITRPGAPKLRLSDVVVEERNSDFRLNAVIEQTQEGPSYELTVPVAVQLQDREHAQMHEVSMTGRKQTLELDLPERPLQLAVDPAFDLFRRLHREEIPPAISQALGGDRVLVVLPAGAPEPLREAYTQLARSWQQGRGAHVDLRRDDQIDVLPNDRVVWLLGWENRFRPLLGEALAAYEFESDRNTVTVGDKTLTQDANVAVILGPHPGNPDQALAWVATDNPAAMPGLARKLPHYGKYSYLGFTGDEPENILKGQWPVTASPLSVTLVEGATPVLALAPREPLAELPAVFSRERMLNDVRLLADPALKGRGLGSPGLDVAAEHVADQFRKIGLVPAGDSGKDYFQSWQTHSGAQQRLITLRNVVGALRVTNAGRAEESVVVGAHLTNVRQLTFGGQNSEAYFSFDGSELIFQTTRGDGQCDVIYRMNADGSNQRPVSSGEGATTCAFIAPDDKSIIYASTHLGGQSCPPKPDMSQGYVWPLYDTYDIFRADPEGGNVVRLTDTPGYDAEAVYSPQGDKIVFTSVQTGDLELFLMNPDGSGVEQLTNTPGYDGGAFFSRDGKWIVWRASRPTGEKLADYTALLEQGLIRPGQLEILIMNLTDRQTIQLTDNRAANFGPYWHPDGGHIIFASNLGDPKGRNFDLYLLNVETRDIKQVTNFPGFDGFPMFSHDGKHLVFTSNRNNEVRGETNVFIADWRW